MRIYRIAFRNPMDTAANTIADKILKVIMNLYRTNRLFSQNKRVSSINIKYPGFEDPIKSTIYIDLFEGYVNPPFNIQAKYSSDQPSPFLVLSNPNAKSINRQIEVFIDIAKNFNEKSFNDFYMKASMSIRHELTHLIQDQEKMPIKYPFLDYNPEIIMKEQDPVKRFPEMRKYLASMFEQEPFIRGFMLSCKKQRIPVISALQEYIHNQLFTNSPIEEQRIKKAYGLEADHIEPMLINLYKNRVKDIFPNTKNIS